MPTTKVKYPKEKKYLTSKFDTKLLCKFLHIHNMKEVGAGLLVTWKHELIR